MEMCLFCKIARGDIKAHIVYEDETAVIFKDIQPQAPTHLLAIPRKHFESVDQIPANEMEVITGVMRAVTAVVKKEKLAGSGYRLVINAGRDAAQSVPHLHVHILSGRAMQWPPG